MADFITDWQDLVKADEIRLPDRPKSLMEGIAGTVAFWVDALATLTEGAELRGFPGMGDGGAF